MTTFHSRTIRRQAFTLVELMIVIAIIGLLVAMLSAAIYKAIIKGKETRNRIEIGQLEVALQQFQQRFGVFPPSRLKLCENFNYYGGTQLDVDSVAFIQKMFTNIDMDVWKGLKPPYGMNWNGNKDPATGADLIARNGGEPNFVILEGDQVLVFCLGGIPA